MDLNSIKLEEKTELVPDCQKFEDSFDNGFIVVMKSGEDNLFRAVTADGEYAFELDPLDANAPKRIVGLDNSWDINETIAGYQEKTTLQFMKIGDYPLPDPIPKEYRKIVTADSVIAYLSELSVHEKTEEYKVRMNAIFDTWNVE